MPFGAPVVVVAGSSGAGKSTLCQRVADAAAARGRRAGGFVTERRTAGRPLSGLDVVNAATGERCPLAEWDAPTGGPSTGRWFFHDAAFATGFAWCRTLEPGALLIVDELGPLEIGQGLGWAPIIPGMSLHDGPVLTAVRPSLALAVVTLMGERETTIVTVDPANREEAFARVLSGLGLAT